jgi:hypothetical protein
MVLVETGTDELALKTQLPDDEQNVIKKLEANATANLHVAVSYTACAGSCSTATVESAVGVSSTRSRAQNFHQRRQSFLSLLPEKLA